MYSGKVWKHHQPRAACKYLAMSLETRGSEDKHIIDARAAFSALSCVLLNVRRFELKESCDSALAGLPEK